MWVRDFFYKKVQKSAFFFQFTCIIEKKVVPLRRETDVETYSNGQPVRFGGVDDVGNVMLVRFVGQLSFVRGGSDLLCAKCSGGKAFCH